MSFLSQLPYATGRTIFALAKQRSNGYFWNPTAVAFQSAPSLANKKIAHTEGAAEYISLYGATIGDMGDVGWVDFSYHDDDASDECIGTWSVFIAGGVEVSPATAPDGTALAKEGADSDTLETLSDQLDGINAKLVPGEITFTSTVTPGSLIPIIEGNTYATAIGNAIEFVATNWAGPDVTGLTVFIAFTPKASYEVEGVEPTLAVEGTVAMVGSDAVFTYQLTAAETELLLGPTGNPKRDFVYEIYWVTGSGEIVTPRIGQATVTRKVRGEIV